MVARRSDVKPKLVTKSASKDEPIVLTHLLERFLVHSAEIELFLRNAHLQCLRRLHHRCLRTLIAPAQLLLECSQILELLFLPLDIKAEGPFG